MSRGGVHLADFHVDAAVVLADVEVEVLVVDAQVAALGQLALEPASTARHRVPAARATHALRGIPRCRTYYTCSTI